MTSDAIAARVTGASGEKLYPPVPPITPGVGEPVDRRLVPVGVVVR
jgi:hypothetical protein